jgi:hypothetical protein
MTMMPAELGALERAEVHVASNSTPSRNELGATYVWVPGGEPVTQLATTGVQRQRMVGLR